MGQNAEQYEEGQRLGSVEVFAADYSTGANEISLGIGEGFSYSENITALDGRPDNGTKPLILTGVAEQSAEITGTLWSLDLDVIAKIRGGIDVKTVDAVTGATTLATGGLTAQVPQQITLVNKTQRFATADDVARWVTAPTGGITFAEGDKIIVIMTTTFFKANFTSGEAITFTNDSDANPIMKYPFTMTAEEDNEITVSSGNLYKRVETVELPS